MDKQEAVRLADSELRIMEQLWLEGSCTAKHLADVMAERWGWNINSTYTLIKRCIKKGAIARQDPGFVCEALVSRDQVRRAETDKLLDKLFGGSANLLFAALLDEHKLSAEELRELRKKLEELEEETS
ncbi:MAG: BlaI/MecI/CopY family transcriptional regulator [Lachnospiraceae bacterium]|nr:BlaI/MecI/CopY family transcriptional regulator [Lachnospiraceae bacterium]